MGADGRVKLWDLTRQQLGEIAYFPKGHLRQVAFHPLGTRLVVAMQPLHVHGGDGWLVSCDLRTGQQLSVIDRRLGGFRHVAFDPAGKFIATDWGHEIRLWDATSDQRLRELSGHDSNVFARDAMRRHLQGASCHLAVATQTGPAGLQEIQSTPAVDRVRTVWPSR